MGMSCLDAEKEKQEEQNQAAISCMAFTTTLPEEIRSLIETECVQMGLALDRGSTELCRQLEDLESRLKVEIRTNASTIQEHKTQLEAFSSICGSNSARIEELASSQTRSLESLWDLQQKTCQNVLQSQAGLRRRGFLRCLSAA